MKRLITLYFIFWGNFASAQYSKDYEKAELFFSKGEYANALCHYQYCKKDEKICGKIISCYDKLSKLNEAVNFAEKMYKKTRFSAVFCETYSNLLIKSGKYALAKKLIQKYPQKTEQMKSLLSIIDTAQVWLKQSQYTVKPININTEFEETSPFLIENQLYFSSNREGVFIKDKSPSTQMPNFELYRANKISNDNFSSPQKALSFTKNEEIINFSFFEDSSKIYFSKLSKDEKGNEKLDFFFSSLINKKLVNPHEFVFNSANVKKAFPHITFDEKMFFFSANMPGGFGGMDIYVCLNVDNKWTDPVNLGDKINTPFDEISPYFSQEGDLYFSSNKLEGMGGYDLYVSKQQDGDWQKPKNLKSPVNSHADEWGFFKNKLMSEGYFVSTRNKHKADIFYFTNNLLFRGK
jgi:hypothetical protein